MGWEGNREFFYGKRICRHQPANSFLRIAGESEKAFARIFGEFLKCSGLQKQACFRWTIQIMMTLTPPPVFEKKCCLLESKWKIKYDLLLDIENHFILSQKVVLDGDSQY